MQFFDKLAELERTRAAFAVATVVARRSPVSSHLGDRAVVHADGRMEGFVGGSCSRDIVRRHALLAMRAGKPRLLQIRPDDTAETDGPAAAERISVPMGCASNGAVDVYIEPHVPPRLLIVVGFTPVADALARMAVAALEFEVVRVVVGEELRDVEALGGTRVVALDDLGTFLERLDAGARTRLALVVASQGHYDERALETVLAGPSGPFVGLVASRKRAATVRGVLAQAGVRGEALDTIRNPVGIDIGARSAPEVAVSILAEIIAQAPVVADETPALATDLVCGMDVEIATSRYRAEHSGLTLFFCSPGCQAAFGADPDRFLTPAELL
jgi:xanthine dehydrogenase accessory factor